MVGVVKRIMSTGAVRRGSLRSQDVRAERWYGNGCIGKGRDNDEGLGRECFQSPRCALLGHWRNTPFQQPVPSFSIKREPCRTYPKWLHQSLKENNLSCRGGVMRSYGSSMLMRDAGESVGIAGKDVMPHGRASDASCHEVVGQAEGVRRWGESKGCVTWRDWESRF